MNALRSILILLAVTPITSAADLVVTPKSIDLRDAYAGSQILVDQAGRDATRSAQYTTSNPAIVRIDSMGYVTPTGDGSTTIIVKHEGGEASIPVTVKGIANGRAIDFQTEIMPLLSKLGCNAGGCHGKASGQNGFKLSLFGFDAEFDYAAITKEARGRRIFPSAPSQSLFIVKATAKVPHGGGKRLIENSESYKLVERWIAAGAPASAPEVPKVTKLKMVITDRVMKKEQTQQLAVIAEYSDGSTRDVTRQAEFAGNLDVVASVDHDGLVTARQQSGEAAIMARYMGYVSVFRAIVPHGEPLTAIPEFLPINYIDKLSVEKWKKLGLRPSPTCDDATFLRRVTIDVCGRLPTVAEIKAFQADTSADKRAKLIDRLLETPDYAAFFAMRWGSILRNSNLAGSDRAAYAFHNWLRDMISRNRPYDEFVRGVVAASGEWQDAPAINWFWQSRDDQLHQVTADTAQVFLGVRLQCAKCHHHPYERWGQADYYGLSGFYTRLGRKSFGEPPPYFASATVTSGEKNPLTGKTPEPKYLDGPEAKFTPEEDPRHALVDWMAKPENPFFAKTLVNRLWGHFFARGLYHEIDDLRETNPPSNPELLDALAKDFIDHKFDMKHMMRTILNSRVYQLSSEPTPHNLNDKQNFARYYARRMLAEVFLDSVDQTTGSKTRFNNVSMNARAIDLPHENFGSYFLDTFDRPRRVSGCECERSSSATLSQVLLLANSEEIENKISSGEGHVAKMIKEKRPFNEAVEELYLHGLSRKPTPRELEKALAFIQRNEDKQRALEDVLWTIINSKEFMFNH